MTRHRVMRLRTTLRERRLDALFVSSLPNIRYLTGFTGSNALCVFTATRGFFLTDTRYRDQSRAEVGGIVRAVTTKTLAATAAERGYLDGCGRVGFESNATTYHQYRALRGLFPRHSLQPTADLVEDLAVVKDDQELACIRRAVAITEQVFLDMLNVVRPGMRENEVAAMISYLQKMYGADGDAFETIVAGGARGALPHARASERKMHSGEFVTLDFGCTVGGYASDLTRTVALGRVTRRMREVYGVVRDAQAAAIAAARPDMWARDLDAVARRHIAAAGYGKFFSHSLGHGLGLHVHERPRVSMLSTERLRTGSVITIEPGIYIPGECGVRIEDDVVLTHTGCEVLTTAPKELLTL
jgi:Xaa-Pro aminopeptidase